MLRYARYAAPIFLIALLWSAPAGAGEQTVLRSPSEDYSYAAGVAFVRTLQQRAGTVNLDLVIRGMHDALTGERLLMTETDIRRSLAGVEDGRGTKQLDASREPAPPAESTKQDRSPAAGGQGDDGQRIDQPRSEQKGQFARTGTTGQTAGTSGPGRNIQAAASPGTAYTESPVAAPDGSLVPRRYQTIRSAVERRAMRDKTIAAHRAQQ